MEEEVKTSKNDNKIILIVISVILILSMIYFLYPKSDNKEITKTTVAPNIGSLEMAVSNEFSTPNVINLSVAYINNNTPGKAVELLNRLLKKDSSNAIVYNNLGTALIMLRNYDEGIEACKKAIQLDTSFSLAKNNLKWGLDELAKVKLAILKMNGLEESKKDADYYIQLGIYHLNLKEYDSCIHTCELGIKAFPDHKKTYLNNIGTALVIKKQFSKAIAQFNAVLAIDPTDQLAKNNIAWAMMDSTKVNN